MKATFHGLWAQVWQETWVVYNELLREGSKCCGAKNSFLRRDTGEGL